MNFIIQDNTAMTLETNLVKIIEKILYDEKGGRLTIAEIAESIKKRFDLSFSNEEIKTAIRKKGRHIQNIEHGYILKPDYRKTLSNQEDFNSNKNSILALLDNVKENGEQFKKSESDIKLINLFLNWENEEKNKFVYNILSYGYVYCSLTAKKDEILANRLFRGKNYFRCEYYF